VKDSTSLPGALWAEEIEAYEIQHKYFKKLRVVRSK
jgi:hypothetical protein